MKYKELVAVTGLSGLYQLLTTKSDGAIVKSLSDNTTKFISARKHNVTPLDSIEVYTTGDNVRLQIVFQKMLENETTIVPVNVKTATNAEIKTYFTNIFSEFDQERVYVSDMKKMLKWYELLKEKNLLVFNETEENTTEENESEITETKAEVTEEKIVDKEEIIETTKETSIEKEA